VIFLQKTDNYSSSSIVTNWVVRSTRSQPRQANVTLFDLAPSGVYHAFFVTKKAVSSYLTFSPLPLKFQLGRFIFCGTFPRVASAGYYPELLPCGARTFLLIKPSSYPIIWLKGFILLKDFGQASLW